MFLHFTSLIYAQVLMCVVFAWLVAQLIPWSTGILLVNYKAQMSLYFFSVG